MVEALSLASVLLDMAMEEKMSVLKVGKEIWNN